MPRRACTLGLLLLFVPAAGADDQAKTSATAPIAPLDLSRLLDTYAAGRFDEAVKSVARAGDEIGRRLRLHWAVAGRQWIDADPAHRPQRILVAAALALETEHIRAERGDWRSTVGSSPCAVAASCVLDWAQRLLVERGAPDQAERAWYLAAAALAGGVRDWRYLQRPGDPVRADRIVPGLMDRAVARFPADPSLQLEKGIAATGRFNLLVDGGRRAPSITLPPSILNRLSAFSIESLGLDPSAAAAMLAALVDDPLVGHEARLRLGYLYWVGQRDEAAHNELTKAAEQARDADVRYLARFLLGWTAIKRGDTTEAIPQLEAALAERPGSQSAAVALAALELQRGDAGKGHQVARASLDRQEAAVDPWRLFLYGHHSQWPARLGELRRSVRP